MSGHEVWGRCALHVALSDFPSPRDFCIVAGISLGALDHALVRFGPDVGRLKLSRTRCQRNKLSGIKVTGPCIVEHNIEVTSFGQCGVECRLDEKGIGEIKTDRMPPRDFWDAFQIAGCAPDLVTLRHE